MDEKPIFKFTPNKDAGWLERCLEKFAILNVYDSEENCIGYLELADVVPSGSVNLEPENRT